MLHLLVLVFVFVFVYSYLNDPKTFDQKLVELGELHLTKLGVKKRHFKHFRQGFMKAIREYIPWSERREAAWLWFWNQVINRMSSDTACMLPKKKKFAISHD